MHNVLLSPPVAFAVLLALSALLSVLFKRLAAHGRDYKSKRDAYACGETMPENQGQPEYAQFFHFAFFFTVMHVTALMIATDVHSLSWGSLLYLMVSVLALFMLFRKERQGH